MRDDLDDELPPCVGAKMRDIAQGFRMPPERSIPVRPARPRGSHGMPRMTRADAWDFYRWASQLGRWPNVKEISEFMEVGKANAYLWRAHWISYFTPDKRTNP